MTTGNKKEIKPPYFGSFILDTLTLGMYAESRNAIREYVQNSYDSLRSAIAEGRVTAEDAKINVVINVENNSVAIRDNGLGIRASKAAETLINIGASEKDYKNQAGFRGIGRLSGLVFCNQLTFITKARGEAVQTRVVFNAKGIRHDLSPARARLLSLSEILHKNITATEEPTQNIDQHFFEVLLEDLYEAPFECLDINEMKGYLGEVAPVPYHPKFSFAPRIYAKAEALSQKLEEVQIYVHDGLDDIDGTQVFKHYSDSVLVQSSKIQLADIDIIQSETGLWWGWVGKKERSGMYKEDRLKAIRVRVRNIQIDGTQIMGRLFGEIADATSYGRFNDWYIGEIFADPERLIPNARRDGFEELPSWLTAKAELIEVCKDLGKSAYQLSLKSQGDINDLYKSANRLGARVDSLIAGEPEIKEVSIIIAEIDKIQRKVNRATKASDNAVASQLRTIETRLIQYHKKALSKIKTGTLISSPETIATAQREIVNQLITAFNEEFDRETFSRIMKVIDSVVGIVE